MTEDVHTPTQPGQEVETKIAAALERIGQLHRMTLWELGKAHGLSPLQIQILVFIHTHVAPELRSVTHLAREFGVTKQTLSDAVKVLIEKQLLLRETHPSDQRRHLLGLTARGAAHAEKFRTYPEVIVPGLRGWPDDEKTTLLASLLRMIDTLQQEGLISLQRMCFTCRHYRGQKHTGREHYCALLEQPLAPAALRIDCPEHRPA